MNRDEPCSHQLAGAAHFADRAWHGSAEVTENVRLARETYRLRFECPAIARRIVPGQFIMLRLAGGNDPLLGRPLALYDTVLSASGEPIGIDVVYLVVGKLTRRLAQATPGTKLDVWGPLGNGFQPAATEHLVMVAGGIGQTPFPAVAREYLGLRRYGEGNVDDSLREPGANAEFGMRNAEFSDGDPNSAFRIPHSEFPTARRATLCYGARSADYLAGVDDFRQLGVGVRVSTDDGTAGYRGLVTDVLREILKQAGANSECGMWNAEFSDGDLNSAFRIPNSALQVLCCGPEPMMAAVAGIAREHGVSCQVSLETPMACGIGICFSCVAKVRQADGSWDYRRTCVEGPVFEAQQIEW